jgi:hypothetical protein
MTYKKFLKHTQAKPSQFNTRYSVEMNFRWPASCRSDIVMELLISASHGNYREAVYQGMYVYVKPAGYQQGTCLAHP